MKTAGRTKVAKLTLADCIVRAARGFARADGGIAFSGMLWVRDQPIASFHNDGNGGCCEWAVRNREAFAEFEALAKTLNPSIHFEQADHVAGQLWDAAFLKAAA